MQLALLSVRNEDHKVYAKIKTIRIGLLLVCVYVCAFGLFAVQTQTQKTVLIWPSHQSPLCECKIWRHTQLCRHCKNMRLRQL